jgi:hypothetical protein
LRRSRLRWSSEPISRLRAPPPPQTPRSPPDGQATAKFATDGGINGFRTLNTIPWWGSSFTFQGRTFPFTMVGHAPSTNSSATVPTMLIPIRFIFSPASNFGGGNFSDVRDPLAIDPGTGLSSIQGTVDSPLFNVATYPDNVGTVQFGDAIQRATFNKTGANGYHVMLGAPTVLPVTTINMPANVADVHAISARIDSVWFGNRLRQLINSLHISPKVVPIILTYDTVLFVGHNKADCCIVGFHGAFSSLNGNGAQQVQTFIYEAFISPGIFRNRSFVDALAFSHEVSEWENDPFVVDNSPRLKAGDSCFIGTSRVGHGPPRSYGFSTGVHREPHGKDILGGVDVPVMPDAAFRARPLAHVQGQGLKHMATRMTAFGTGIPAVNLDQGSSVPFRFVFQLAHQLAPTHIAYRFGEHVIADQVLDGQRLHADRLVLTNEACRQFVEAVTALVSDTGMFTRHLQARLLPVLGPLLFAAEIALGMLQAALAALEVARVGNLLAGAEHRHIFQPHIHAHHGVDDR